MIECYHTWMSLVALSKSFAFLSTSMASSEGALNLRWKAVGPSMSLLSSASPMGDSGKVETGGRLGEEEEVPTGPEKNLVSTE